MPAAGADLVMQGAVLNVGWGGTVAIAAAGGYSATLDLSQGAQETYENSPPFAVAADIFDLVLAGPVMGSGDANVVLGANNLGVDTLTNGMDFAPHGSDNTYDPGRGITGTGTLYNTLDDPPLSFLSTEALNFGYVHVGQSEQQSVTVRDFQGNGGGWPMHGAFLSNGLTDRDLVATGFVTPTFRRQPAAIVGTDAVHHRGHGRQCDHDRNAERYSRRIAIRSDGRSSFAVWRPWNG